MKRDYDDGILETGEHKTDRGKNQTMDGDKEPLSAGPAQKLENIGMGYKRDLERTTTSGTRAKLKKHYRTRGTPTGGTPTGGTPPCPPSWSQWRDKCYKMHNASVTWEEGKQICVELGGMMVVPQEEELQHILNMCISGRFWIGCNDMAIEGTWECLDGGETFGRGSNRWAYGEPSNGIEDCVEGRASGWNDLPCNVRKDLFCQRPVAPAQ
ncbi:CD209 antigen-like protein C [Asterias amurensis]|uniref:CD209 antigen-like protein C n=1 Tax=Asterias amurensis TaxID=7602 RepID=UPI003AB6DB1E